MPTDIDTATSAGQVDRLRQMFLCRFDMEHTFRYLKQTLGWAKPRVRDPQAADRWTWLVVAAYTQLQFWVWLRIGAWRTG